MANTQGLDAANVANIIQSVALVASLVGVILTLIWSSIVARRRATLDLILSEMLDPRQIEMRTQFVKLRDAGNLVQFASPSRTASDEAQCIAAILNAYELIAIGIRRKIIDENSYKDWTRATLVKEWCACKPFVTEIRRSSKHPTYYVEFEALANKWATKEERKHC